MHQVNLKLKLRIKTGKEHCKKLKQEGLVPGIIYGKNFDNVMVTLDEKELKKAISSSAGTRVIIVLEVEDNGNVSEYTTMVNDIQKDIFQKRMQHIDLQKISLDEKVHAEIPIILRGESKGVKAGGILDQIIWRVPIHALPLEMPERLVLDITELEENDSLRLKDIKLPPGAVCLEDLDEMVCIVHPPRVVEEETAAAGEEGAAAEVAAPAGA